MGYRSPMIAGSLFNLGATLSFAYLRNYYLLIVARTLQAAGSSLSVIAGILLHLLGIYSQVKGYACATIWYTVT